MTKRYEDVIKKHNRKARKRVRAPKTIQDYMTNLTLDVKSLQNNLTKLDTARWEVYQITDSMRQMIRILRNKKLVGKFEDWEDIICEECKFKKKMVEILVETEEKGTIQGEGDDQEIVFNKEEWQDLIKKLNEEL